MDAKDGNLGWPSPRPIWTAPEKGRILIFTARSKEWITAEFQLKYGGDEQDIDRYRFHRGDPSGISYNIIATHWVPLPPTPEQSEAAPICPREDNAVPEFAEGLGDVIYHDRPTEVGEDKD